MAHAPLSAQSSHVIVSWLQLMYFNYFIKIDVVDKQVEAIQMSTNNIFFMKKIKGKIQSTLVISNSKGLTETLRDIRTSTYQSWESEENNKLNNHI